MSSLMSRGALRGALVELADEPGISCCGRATSGCAARVLATARVSEGNGGNRSGVPRGGLAVAGVGDRRPTIGY